ncbi:MAG: N utilization substance protein B-like protein [Parcubacteria group bacterium GW2011_GWB1_40_14]|nr:MAG: N utilization substance protein B-like protein [Parcubacteria group bacterium GW2011_GWB1_40_14]
MANRHLARSLAMQALYKWDFNGCNNEKIDAAVEYVITEFGPGLEEEGFVKMLVNGVLDKKKEIDTIIEKAAPEWPLEQIAMVDRNVLRVGIYELLFGDRNAVPPKVAINESIELAKSFGGETSGKFINGVLGTIYREIGEPMKDHIKTKPDEDLPEELLVGAAVINHNDKDIKVLWLKDKYGFWVFPKGHLTLKDKNSATALKRELKKEIGITDITVGEAVGDIEYVSKSTSKGKSKRKITYFIVETKTDKIEPSENSKIVETRWVSIKDPAPGDYYHDLDGILEKTREILS